MVQDVSVPKDEYDVMCEVVRRFEVRVAAEHERRRNGPLPFDRRRASLSVYLAANDAIDNEWDVLLFLRIAMTCVYRSLLLIFVAITDNCLDHGRKGMTGLRIARDKLYMWYQRHELFLGALIIVLLGVTAGSILRNVSSYNIGFNNGYKVVSSQMQVKLDALQHELDVATKYAARDRLLRWFTSRLHTDLETVFYYMAVIAMDVVERLADTVIGLSTKFDADLAFWYSWVTFTIGWVTVVMVSGWGMVWAAKRDGRIMALERRGRIQGSRIAELDEQLKKKNEELAESLRGVSLDDHQWELPHLDDTDTGEEARHGVGTS